MTQPSPGDGERYLWRVQGAEDNERARREGLNSAALELSDLLDGLARLQAQSQAVTAESLITAMARIHAPHVLKGKYRR